MKFSYERNKIANGFEHVIGCDEVGRGCLAGPVVAAAVIIDPLKIKKAWASKVKDSKQLLPEVRQDLAPIIKQSSLAWGIGVVSHHKIDEINIHHASLLAMKKAVNQLMKHSHILENVRMSMLCVDGRFTVPQLGFTQEAVIDADNKVFSVACASIVAKVYRDTLMQKLDRKFPQYLFAKHKGYATKTHRSLLKEHGISEIHRLSFCANLF